MALEIEEQEKLHQARSERLEEARAAAKNDEEKGAGKAKKLMRTTKSVAQLASPLGLVSLFKYADMFKDMPYVAALGAALLKDLLDLADFETVVLPVLFSILCGIFIAMMLFLVGARKKKSAASNFVRSTVAIIAGSGADAIPGLDLLPIETMTVVVLYVWALMDRKNDAENGETINESY